MVLNKIVKSKTSISVINLIKKYFGQESIRKLMTSLLLKDQMYSKVWSKETLYLIQIVIKNKNKKKFSTPSGVQWR